MKLSTFLETQKPEFSLLEMSTNELNSFERELNELIAPFGLKAEVGQHARNRLLDDGQYGRLDTAHVAYQQTGRVKADYSTNREAGVDSNKLLRMFQNVFFRSGKMIVAQKQKGVEFLGTIMEASGLNVSFKIDYQNKGESNILRLITIMEKRNFIPKQGDAVFKVALPTAGMRR